MWPQNVSVLSVCVLLLGAVQSANILCYFFAPSISHQITFQPIIRALAKNGHNLTVITPNPLRDPSLTNVDEIDIQKISYAIWEKHNISSFGVNEEATDLGPIIDAYMEIVEAQLMHPRVLSLINDSSKYHFDMLITEYPHIFAVPFKRIYNTSMIGISSMPLHLGGGRWIGNPAHPVLFPDLNLPFPNKLTFWEKVQSFLHFHIGMWFLERLRPQLFGIMAKVYNTDIMNTVEDIFREYDMVFVNYNPILHVRRPNVPALIEFSGIHIQPPMELPQDIKSYLDTASQGAIYISFGSNIKSSALPAFKRQMILDTLSELPYMILWKFEADLENLPKNVRIIKWAPQQDVLRHPNIKLFITQGGLQSLDEAMYTKTPVVAIPFFGDQLGNAAKVEETGLGKRLNFASLTKDALKASILEVINDDKYKLRMEEVYDILTDKPMSAVDKTVWWVEYVLRHKGARHLKCPTVDATVIEYYMIDVIGFLLGVVLLKLFFIYIAAKLMIKLARRALARGCRRLSDGAKKLKKN